MSAADGDSDELEINVRPAGELAGRLVILASLLRRIALETASPEEDASDDDEDDDQGVARDDREDDRFDIIHWLAEQRLATSLSREERHLLETPVGQLAEAAASEASVAASEALAALAWIAGFGELPGDPDLPADPAPLLARIPAPWDSVSAFAATLQPATDESAAGEREAAELWFWRLSVEEDRRSASEKAAAALQAVIRDAAFEAADAGYWQTIDGDVLLGDQSVAKAPQDLLDFATDLARARLHAMNWACGHGATWDSVPLDL